MKKRQRTAPMAWNKKKYKKKNIHILLRRAKEVSLKCDKSGLFFSVIKILCETDRTSAA